MSGFDNGLKQANWVDVYNEGCQLI